MDHKAFWSHQDITGKWLLWRLSFTEADCVKWNGAYNNKHSRKVKLGESCFWTAEPGEVNHEGIEYELWITAESPQDDKLPDD